MAIRKIRVSAVQYRNFDVEFDRADTPAEGGAKRYPVSFSSEYPVLRFGWLGDRYGYYNEVLGHTAAEVDLSRAKRDGRLTFLRQHNTDLVIGSIVDPLLNEKRKRMEGMAEFSSIPSAQESQTLVDENHLRRTSLGYEITDMVIMKAGTKTEPPTYRCSWQPFEVSLVSIPADPTVGIGRSMEEHQRAFDQTRLAEFEVEVDDEEIIPESPPALPIQGERQMSIPAGVAPTTPAEPPAAAPTAAAQVVRDYGLEMRQLNDIAAQCEGKINDGLSPIQRANKWMQESKTPDMAAREAFNLMLQQAVPATPHNPDLPKDIRKKYSFVRAIEQATRCADLKVDARLTGYEGEIEQQLRKDSKELKHGGVLLPLVMPRTEEEQEIYARGLAQMNAARALGTNVANAGQTLVPTELMDLIDVTRNKSRCMEMGAQVYTGLSGTIPWPRQLTTSTIGWGDENPAVAINPSQPTFDSVTGTPKSMAGQTVISRQLTVMAAFDVEAKMKGDLGLGIGIAHDYAGIAGRGAVNSEPTGILNTNGILGQPYGGVPTNSLNVAMQTQLALANALDGLPGYLANPSVAGYCMSHELWPGASLPMWSGRHDEGVLAGYRAKSTNQVPGNLGDALDQQGLIFADWSQLVFLIWGNAVEIIVDPYSLAGKQQLVITVFGMGDVILQRLPSFCAATGLKVA